jgi:hypothetical protein
VGVFRWPCRVCLWEIPLPPQPAPHGTPAARLFGSAWYSGATTVYSPNRHGTARTWCRRTNRGWFPNRGSPAVPRRWSQFCNALVGVNNLVGDRSGSVVKKNSSRCVPVFSRTKTRARAPTPGPTYANGRWRWRCGCVGYHRHTRSRSVGETAAIGHPLRGVWATAAPCRAASPTPIAGWKREQVDLLQRTPWRQWLTQQQTDRLWCRSN